MWQRFSVAARQAIFHAQEEATSLGHDTVRTEHLLMGLTRNDGLLQPAFLRGLGLTTQAILDAVTPLALPATTDATRNLTLAPRSKRVIDLAHSEAQSLISKTIESEHIFLGILVEGDGAGGRALQRLGLKPDKVRNLIFTLQHGEDA